MYHMFTLLQHCITECIPDRRQMSIWLDINESQILHLQCTYLMTKDLPLLALCVAILVPPTLLTYGQSQPYVHIVF